MHSAHNNQVAPTLPIYGILQQRALAPATAAKMAYAMLNEQAEIIETLSHSELYGQSNIIAHYLSERFGSNKTVLLIFPNSLEFIKAIFGCFYAGNIAVPIEPPRPHHSLNKFYSLIEDVDPVAILSTKKLRTQLSTLSKNVEGHCNLPAIIYVEDVLAQHSAPEEWKAVENELAILQYTSGSTGVPKGVIISHSNLVTNLSQIRECSELNESSVGLSWLPFFHDMGLIGGMFLPLFVGLPVYLFLPASFVKRPFIWINAISKYGVTVTVAPNFAFELCIQKITPEQCQGLKLDSLEVAFIGAETIRADTLKRFTEKFQPFGFKEIAFLPCYGMAEVTLLATGTHKSELPAISYFDKASLEQNEAKQLDSNSENAIPIVSCGKSPSNITVRIVDTDSLQICDEQKIGEIWVAGPNVSKGYWKKSKQETNAFGNKLPDTNEDFLRTGDLGFLLNDELYVTGRLKDLIIINGRNIFPQDIEYTVERSNSAMRLMGAAAFAVDHGQEQLVILAEIDRQAVPSDLVATVASIRTAVLQEFEIDPGVIELVRDLSLPKTSSGKIRRKACKKNFEENKLHSIFRWANPDSWKQQSPKEVFSTQALTNKDFKEIQTWLINKVAGVKKIDSSAIDPSLPFTNFGLDSVTLLQVVADLENWLGKTIPVSAPYEYNCITDLSRYLANEATHSEVITPITTNHSEEIAIVGMSCRFPGAANLKEFWELLVQGKDAITEVPRDRWDNNIYFDPSLRSWDKTNTKWGGFMDNPAGFDPGFFNISDTEAKSMDPQQRLLLELTWEALDDTGINSKNWRGKPVGVFVGISNSEYSKINGPLLENDLFWSTSNALSIAANRISYQFDFKGPSISVDTACSSSLTATKLAFDSLRMGECEMAIAGGVNMILNPELNVNFSQAGALSADGRCKPFDKNANGIVRSEGGGIIVLKTLARAKADGDRIYGIISGGALNHDGRTNGLSAPNPLSQEMVIRSALANAGVQANKVQYIEAHGTGTSLGDPIEVKALQKVYDEARAAGKKYTIGSVKSNIGHLEAAAGIASLIKVALSLHHNQLPPTIHYSSINPYISLANSQLDVQHQLSSWSDAYEDKFAGVSGFGFGGTNVHLILKAAPAEKITVNEFKQDLPYLMLLSGSDENALKQVAKDYYAFLSENPEEKQELLSAICYNLAVKRTHLLHRLAVSCSNLTEALSLLQLAIEGKKHHSIAMGRPNPNASTDMVFVYSGHGGQWKGMGQRLLVFPAFRATIQQCDIIIKELAGWSLMEQLLSNKNDETEDTVDIVQPVIFAIQIAYTNLLHDLGIRPSMVTGHSMGEAAAAFAVGALSLKDAIKIIIARSRLLQDGLLMQETESAMAMIKMAPEKLAKYLAGKEEHLSVAVHNGPEMVVIGGTKTVLTEVLDTLKEEKISFRLLRTPGAGHSPQMEPLKQKLIEQLQDIQPKEAHTPMFSTAWARPVKGNELNAKYWGDNLRMTVQFFSATEYAAQNNYQYFVEINPDALLASSIKDNYRHLDVPANVIPVAKRTEDEILHLYRALGQLMIIGWYVDREKLFIKKEPHTELLSYPWQRRNFWKEKVFTQQYKITAKTDIAPHADGLLQIDWIKLPLQTTTESAKDQTLLIFTGETALEHAINTAVQKHTSNAYFVTKGDAYFFSPDKQITIRATDSADHQALIREIQAATNGNPIRILFLWSMDEGDAADNLQQKLTATFLSFNLLITALMRYRAQLNASVCMITRGGQAVVSQQQHTNPLQTAIWGFGRSLSAELAQMPVTMIDLDPAGDIATEVLMLLQELNENAADDQLAYRNGERWAGRLNKHASLVAGNYNFKTDKTYLITGGMGGIGFAMAEWMVEKGARRIILLSRTALPPRKQWSNVAENDPLYHRIQQIKKLELMGANIIALTVDVGNKEQLFEALDQFNQEQWPAIAGVFHLAGVLSWQPCSEITAQELLQVFQPKAFGAWNLHEYFNESPLDFFVLFSSGSAILNSPYLATYSAANAFLDGLAWHRQHKGLVATSINWGFWSETGMASQKINEQTKNYKPAGLREIKNNEAFALLDQILSSPTAAQYIYMPFDWESWKQRYPELAAKPFISGVAGKTNGVLKQSRTKLDRDKLLHMSADEGTVYLETFMIKELAALLNIQSEELSRNLKINEIGLDSLMAIELKNQLESDLQIFIPVAKLLEGPTIAQFAVFIQEQLTIAQQNGGAISSTDGNNKPDAKLIKVDGKLVELDKLLTDIDEMNESELDILLKQLSNGNDLK